MAKSIDGIDFSTVMEEFNKGQAEQQRTAAEQQRVALEENRNRQAVYQSHLSAGSEADQAIAGVKDARNKALGSVFQLCMAGNDPKAQTALIGAIWSTWGALAAEAKALEKSWKSDLATEQWEALQNQLGQEAKGKTASEKESKAEKDADGRPSIHVVSSNDGPETEEGKPPSIVSVASKDNAGLGGRHPGSPAEWVAAALKPD